MITKEEFNDFLKAFQTFENAIDRIENTISGRRNSICLWDSDWCESVGKMLDVFLETHFTEEGCDWINYYLFETIKDKVAYIKQDKDMFNEEKKIEYHLNTLDELWNFLLTDRKLYFKNV